MHFQTATVAAAPGRGGWSSSSSASMTSVVDIPSSLVEVVEVFQVPSDSTTGAVVLPASSTGTVVLPRRSLASPTSVLRAIIPLGSPDLSAPTVNDQPSLIASKPAMVWKPELSEFVLNQLVQLIRSAVCFNMGFKEQQMKKVAADVLAFVGVHVTTLQLYNHIRNWRTKWIVIMKMKSDRILDWSEDGCCFYDSDEGAADEYIMRYPKHHQYVSTPVTNYAQMETIFTLRFVCKAQLFQPNLLVRAIDFIAHNEAEYAVYRKLQPPERRSWLRTWLRNQFPAWLEPEEKAAEHRALVESFETLKKAEDAANKALRQQLLEDAAVHRALAAARRMERWAMEKLRREGGNDGAGPSTAQRGDK
ncbi:hypothetical protein QYE76_044760 [Lolium multiflorum]|uniref:Myb/SANT-like domain-containing protein n=1 Tax=Lolium multiflorum TaxID=4521 RepID=A0AAD8WWU6_LOLMU|nr:hypothetical protein QYE76_044760 [Lolium multiflorum]